MQMQPGIWYTAKDLHIPENSLYTLMSKGVCKTRVSPDTNYKNPLAKIRHEVKLTELAAEYKKLLARRK